MSLTIHDAAKRLEPVYADNGWTWVSALAEDGVPTAPEIQRVIEHLLANTVAGVQDLRRTEREFEGYVTGTGRLEVHAVSHDGSFDNITYELKLDLGEL